MTPAASRTVLRAASCSICSLRDRSVATVTSPVALASTSRLGGSNMLDRRRLLLAMPACAGLAFTRTAATQTNDVSRELDRLGKFEIVSGRPGVVIGVPHGTADNGTLDAGRIVCKRLGVAGVFVTGFWDPKTRQRINVNRPTEQVIGPDSQVLREWSSDRAVAANARYDELVRKAAQGRVRVFFELHSNHRPPYVDSIQVSTLGVGRDEAARFKSAFEGARDHLAEGVPRLAVNVSPLDRVTFPNFGHASTIAKISDKGCAIEHPARVLGNRAWRLAYAECLADAIRSAPWV